MDNKAVQLPAYPLLAVDIKRDQTGTLIDAAKITNNELDLSASGRLATDDSETVYDLTLRDFSIIDRGLGLTTGIYQGQRNGRLVAARTTIVSRGSAGAATEKP